MRCTTFASLLLLALLPGCGGEPSTSVVVQLPFLLGQSCSLPFDQAWARVHIAGNFDLCTLSVDPTSGHASGRCRDITAGDLWPLAVEWGQAAGATPYSGVVGYTLGTVDLRRASLPPNEEHPTVTVNLQSANTIINEADFAQLAPREGNCALRNRGDPEQWLWCYRTSNLTTDLDCDDDGISNLSEACAGTLMCP